jgi:hypothetical protein
MGDRLRNKVCAITGTGGGIGRAGALRFAGDEASVVGRDVSPDAAEETVRLVRSAAGTMVSLQPVELSTMRDCQRVIDLAVGEFGRVHVLFNFNNAAMAHFNWRDVVQNHMFQILSNLAMEPLVRTDSETIRDAKVHVLKAIPTLEANNIVRGQFRGYRQENGVAADSTVETFAAMRLEVDSWRWKGVPFYIRAGKNLPVTCTEAVARLRKPPALIPECALVQNFLRFRISPEMTIALGTTVMGEGEELESETVEMVASRRPRPQEMDAYERILSDVMAGNPTHFAREDYVEEAWRIVDSVFTAGIPVFDYDKDSWGPSESARVAPPGGWQNPTAMDQEDFRALAQTA